MKLLLAWILLLGAAGAAHCGLPRTDPDDGGWRHRDAEPRDPVCMSEADGGCDDPDLEQIP